MLIENVRGLKDILPNEYKELAAQEIRTIKDIAEHVRSIREESHDMVEARKKWNAVEGTPERANGYETEVRPYLDKIRQHIDKLELIVDDKLWPLPKYRELMTIA